MSRRGVFLDLNGTLVEPLKQERLDDFTVTVQSRIAKGLFSMADFQTWFATFAADLEARDALVVGPYVCPHRYAEPCPCEKPKIATHLLSKRRCWAQVSSLTRLPKQ